MLCDFYGYPQTDFEQAKTYYEACGDNPYAQIALGLLYYYGQGVEEDEEKAKELFQAAIDQGYVEGYCGTARVACNEEDYEKASEDTNKALEGTEQLYLADAMTTIGDLYYDGLGVEQDYAKVMEWYEKAAELNDAYAMNEIGYMYQEGLGVEQDYAKALEWFEKAAEAGNEDAEEAIERVKRLM